MLYIFGDYELDTRLYELRHAGKPCNIEPQVFDVLAYLIQHRDGLVTKEELLEHVWPEQFISETVLNNRIMAARRAIGDSGRTQHCIRTVRGRGYRFVAAMQERPGHEGGGAEQPVLPVPSDTVGGVGDRAGPEPYAVAPPRMPEAVAGRRCGACEQVNSAEARFCVACGSRLAQACASCGHMMYPPAMFCPAYGQHLSLALPEHLSPEPLRSLEAETRRFPQWKQVTVLSCTLANATGLTECVGLEGMHTVMHAFFACARRAVQPYDGTITQCLDDGFVALFGVPIAHEDHARRAVMAAEAIRRRLHDALSALEHQYGVEMAVCIGLHTGLVIISVIGDDQRLDYTAVGDATQVAARLQQAASPGHILISETTHRLVAGHCTTRFFRTFALKDKTEPLPAWNVLAIRETRTRLEVEAERGLTPFVGRQRELRLLSECFAQAQEGHGQVVFIVGEPAIGKSRLLLESRHRLGAKATWLEGHALSFGQSMALHPVIDLLKRNFHIEDDDSEETIIEKITQGVLRLGEGLRSILPYVRYLLGVDPGDAAVRTMDPQLRRAELFGALQRLTLRAAAVRPQIVVFEDLHWIDPATEAFLIFLADSIPTSRVLCLFTYRPGYGHPFGDRTYHTRIVLPALSTADTMQMARALLATDHLPETLATLLVQKAEGNPFFVEEVVKTLQEAGILQQDGGQYILTKRIEEFGVPSTIQDVLMARIDRLAEAPKRVLQLASVIGREFTHRVLNRLVDVKEQTDTSLQELKAIELIYETHRFPELAYVFKHALTQEVTYHSLLVQRRQELHRRTGLAIEELYADRLAEQYEVLTYHFASGEVWDKALMYLCKAAEKATLAFATREALALYDQAVETVAHLGDAADVQTVMALYKARADLYWVLDDFARAHAEYERLLVLARRVGDRERQGMALAHLGSVSYVARDFDRALVEARQAIEIAKEIGSQPVLAAGHCTIGTVHALSGQLEQAEEEFKHTLAISCAVGDASRQAISLVFAGFLKNWKGEFGEAMRLEHDAQRIAREHNLLIELLRSLFVGGIVLIGKGDYDQARTTLEEGLALAEKLGNELYGCRMVNCLGWLYSELGDLDRAIDFNRRGAEGARERGDPEVMANAELNLADIFLAKGDVTQAQELLDGVYHLVQDPATSDWAKWRYSTHLFANLGELWLARGDASKAQEFAHRCLDIATRTTSRKYLVKGWRLQGEIALARRQWDEAEAWLRQALPLAQTVGNPPQLWQSHLALGRLHAEARRPEQARRAYRAARKIIARVKASLQAPGLRASLEHSPLIQYVYDLSASD
jgi:class 3 adenylate cyclase/DNA-binding winged helix-turn-helix (wHTH) protein/tetratricopeptide (TPR) repeat protein